MNYHELQGKRGREEGRSKRGWEGGELFFCVCVQRVTFAPGSSTVACAIDHPSLCSSHQSRRPHKNAHVRK